MSEIKRAVIVAGPQGCGKTLAAPLLLKHFGLEVLEDDDWWPELGVTPGALHLTHEEVTEHPEADVYQFENVAPLVGVQPFYK